MTQDDDFRTGYELILWIDRLEIQVLDAMDDDVRMLSLKLALFLLFEQQVAFIRLVTSVKNDHLQSSRSCLKKFVLLEFIVWV